MRQAPEAALLHGIAVLRHTQLNWESARAVGTGFLRDLASSKMMRTEDDARVSLDDAFTDGTPSPDNSKKGSDKGSDKGTSTSRKKGKKKKKSKGSTESPPGLFWVILRGLFGPLFPLFGGASWESVGTSWVFPDLLHLFWRLASFGVLLGLYLSLTQRGTLLPFSSDVYSFATLASALLLLPHTGLLVVGPHEDDLDASGIRWLWSLVTMALQMAVTHATFMVVLYVNVARGPSFVHITPAALLLSEVLIGCAIPRLSYAIMGAISMAIYLVAVRMNKVSGVGEWLVKMMRMGSWRVHAGIVGVYLLSGICIVAIGRVRARIAWWIERRGDRKETIGPDIQW